MILLQILDEGTVTDSQGRKVDFKVCPNHGRFPSCSAIRHAEYYHLSHEQHW